MADLERTVRTVIVIIVGILLLLLLLAFSRGPEWTARRFNRVVQAPPYRLDEAARTLHQSLLVADLHSDALLWRRDLLKRGRTGHVDLPRLREGNVAIQAFTIVTKTPRGMNIESTDANSDQITLLAMLQRWPPRTWFSLRERALYQARRLQELAARSEGRFVVLRSRRDVVRFMDRRLQEPGLTAGFLGVEGAHALEGSLEAVDALWDAGVRMMAPTHFFDNEVGGSAHGVEKGGLTPFGRRVIERMDSLGMIVDLAHASPAVMEEVLEITSRPVLVSHTGARGVCDNARNLSDDQIRAVAATGGIVGIGLWETAVCGTTPRDVARSLRYVADLVGPDHVALGSDWDGAVTTVVDASGIGLVTEALLREGMSEEEIRWIMGENVLRFLLDNLPER